MGVWAPNRLLGVYSFIYQCTNCFLGAARDAVDRAVSRKEVSLFWWEGHTGHVI